MCDKCRLQTGRRLIASFFLRGGAIQRGDRPDEAGGASLGGGGGERGLALVVETELRSKVAIGGSLQRR